MRIVFNSSIHMVLPNQPKENSIASIEIQDNGLSIKVISINKDKFDQMVHQIFTKAKMNQDQDDQLQYYTALGSILSSLYGIRGKKVDILSARAQTFMDISADIFISAWKDTLYFLSDRKIFTEKDPNDTLRENLLADLEKQKEAVRAQLKSQLPK